MRLKKLTITLFCLLCLSCASKQSAIQGGNATMLENHTSTNLPKSVRFVDSHPIGKELLVRHFQFTNGLEVLLVEDHAAPILSYQTWIRTGSRNEQPGTTGIAHFFEHLMFKPTKQNPEGIFEKVQLAGGTINAGTTKDWTYYYQDLPSKNLEMIVGPEADRLQHLILTDDQINTEREVIREERRFRVEDDVNGRMDEVLYQNAFSKHSYSWPIIGAKKDLDNIGHEQAVAFYKTYYSPNNATIVIVGDIDTEKTLHLLDKHYGAIPASTLPVLKLEFDPAPNAERRHQFKNSSILDDKMTIAFHSPNATHADRVVLEVLNNLLVEGKSSRLHKKLVDETKLAVAVNGYVDSNIDPGLFKISVSLANGHKAEEAEKVIYAEIEKLKQQLATDRELEKTKNIVESYYIRVLKTNQYKAVFLGVHHTVQKDYRVMFSEVEHYRAVKAADIQQAAKQYLTQNNRIVVIARPGAE